MELRQLEHFVAVAQHLSFTRAAREVHVVQSSLSTSVRQLERELGATLFERTTRKVTLTPAGWTLLPMARRILMDARSARESVATVAGVVSGAVAVGTIQMLTWVDLPAALSRFYRAHPGVEITLREAPVDELLDALLAGDLDLAYIARDSSRLPDAVSVLATRDEELVVIAASGHPLAREHQVHLADLRDEPFVDFQAGTGLQTVVERLCIQASLRRRITFAVTQLELLVSLVRAGLGIAIVPAPVARGSGDLARLSIAPSPPHRTLALVSRTPGPGNPAAVALLRDVHGRILR
ncbi:LysR family transcriptional regulator [Blastococcus sp. BMG 814]|uniref:LysR family transcriptional regulator n=1 Tax=Blastococcus carthaginiensis TaxID=3050034 RepID=A0ABT9I8P2_9ACTN|nr:LysR family transcriptional regulator [Blastococcus carthaginiensis]MDP5181946.1 LysR family transcriptional regulator [Blastococcus carthaginiensis]